MNQDDFYSETLGKSFEMDGVPAKDPIQCADYFKKACVVNLGYSWETGGDGYVDNWWYNKDAHASEFDFITDPDDLKNGDFVIWRNAKRGDTPFNLSHVAMYHNGNMIGQNQPTKYVTEKIVDKSVWQRMLGAFRFKCWAGGTTVETPTKGNDLEQINAMGTSVSTRKIATSFHVYAKDNGIMPKMVMKKSNFEGSQIYALQIQMSDTVQIATSYNPDTEWLCKMHSAWMLANGWYELACINAGYFEMSGNVGKPTGAVMTDWSGVWSKWGGEDCVPAAGNGYPTLAWTDGAMMLLDKNASDIDLSKYHWLQGVGQSLVIDSKVNCNVGSNNGRYNISNNASAIGYNNKTGILTFMVNVKSDTGDGKLNTLQRSYVMEGLGCELAVQLDGGGSTQMEWLASALSDSLDDSNNASDTTDQEEKKEPETDKQPGTDGGNESDTTGIMKILKMVYELLKKLFEK